MPEKVKNLIIALGGSCDESNADLLDFALTDSILHAKSICNMDSIPEGFENEIIKYAAGLFFKLLKNSGQSVSEILEPAVKSVSEGDVSVTFENGKSCEDRLDALISDLCGGLEKLVAARRLAW